MLDKGEIVMFGLGIQELLILLVVIGCPAACAVIASKKGRSALLWFILGIIFNFVGLIVIACLGNVEKAGRDMKKCPYCAELVKKDAIVCKHCGKDIAAEKDASPQS